jgi:hypothetical protein
MLGHASINHHPQHLLSRLPRHAGLRRRRDGSGATVSTTSLGLQQKGSEALPSYLCIRKIPLFAETKRWAMPYRTSDPLLVREVKALRIGTPLSANLARTSGFCRLLRRCFPALSGCVRLRLQHLNLCRPAPFTPTLSGSGSTLMRKRCAARRCAEQASPYPKNIKRPEPLKHLGPLSVSSKLLATCNAGSLESPRINTLGSSVNRGNHPP